LLSINLSLSVQTPGRPSLSLTRATATESFETEPLVQWRSRPSAARFHERRKRKKEQKEKIVLSRTLIFLHFRSLDVIDTLLLSLALSFSFSRSLAPSLRHFAFCLSFNCKHPASSLPLVQF